MDKGRAPSQDQVDKFNFLPPMLDSALIEMREFSKKKQDGIVSATKIKILNRILSDVREIVSGEDTVNYLDPLDEQDLPQNSDAVLVLGQYRAALATFKGDHQKYVLGDLRWVTKEWEQEREEYLKPLEEEDEDGE